MARIPRKNKNGQYSKEFLAHIEYSDWQGWLTSSEIEIARDTGLLKKDLWKKARRIIFLTPDQRKQGIEIAPCFGPDGKPDASRYNEETKFLVQDYEDLKRLQKAEKAKNE